jgi:septum site-determining protein MinC
VEDTRPAAVLRGTSRGLEVFVNGAAAIDAIVAAWIKRLEEAPGFFRGSDVRVRIEDGPLAAGCLARLDETATLYGLRIIEVSAAKRDGDAVPQPSLAAGSAPSPSTPPSFGFDEEPTGSVSIAHLVAPPDTVVDTVLHVEPAVLAETDLTDLIELLEEPAAPGMTFDEPTQTAVPLALAATAEAELETTSGTRLVVGPVRSGVILEHAGHLIVFGDVNPGAEIRAEGNIVVLGRLRGTAHAGIGQEVGFILALRLEPQQLRIGRKVARAADSDTPASEAEIASCTGDAIVVERYQGKLPRNLASSI